ncbi:hypothetical protein [Halapricum desulfuricans]|uniref:PD-(D/E)XK superfamily nuclease n=1 Tax=Halapricum desulfuricans TaxID=2841257 RepID=A0A897N6K6_9EURY|nr:hypothetical protein [Halapricum desulfuricans]QSG10020.1 PD-(D/E)XK superfamily nuclease [Halapricum desulfuricans]
MIGGGLGNEVLQYVEEWIPDRSYRSETKFQNDLQEYLDQRLNESGGMGLDIGLGGGSGDQIPVKREHGSVNADVAVGDDIGIEMKRDFTNSKKHRLSGQITDYQKEFPYVIVVACGISDMDGWRELQNEYGGPGGIGMNQGEVHFVHKKKENFGKDPSEVNRDGDGPLGGVL